MKFLKYYRGKLSLLTVIFVIAVGIGAFFLGQFTVSEKNHDHKNNVKQASEVETKTIWTCSMHPQIKKPNPGKCPLCGMTLIPMDTSSGKNENPRELKLSPRAVKIAEVQTMPVIRKFVDAKIRLVGKVEYDETRRKVIAARVPGRLDRLYVDYTGIGVRKGDHLVYLYSPMLLTAQQELLQAIKAQEKLKNSKLKIIRSTALQTVTSSREKLRLLGLSLSQIKNIEKRGILNEHMTIYSPLTGIVIHKNATEGMYVKTGYPIYTVADLSKVWIFLDAYETDLIWLRYGQEVEFETEAYPGEKFKGKIAFISPTLNSKTRTVKVRVNVENKAGLLKPEMFVKAVVHSKIALGGKIMDPELSGKWMCPMHPEIIKKRSGRCSICHMPLVKAESLGFVSPDKNAVAPLVIPVTAPLITGKRAIVYIFNGDDEKPGYEGREIELGARAGDFYIVKSGLKENEHVVTNGNFKIDSALQILGKPSMMNPEGAVANTGHQNHAGMNMKKSGNKLGKMNMKKSMGMGHSMKMDMKKQINCPVMGGKIDKQYFTDYKGQRIYFCCGGCDKTFLKDPETYLKKMAEKGIMPEKISMQKINLEKGLADKLFTDYFSAQKALAKDDLKTAEAQMKKLYSVMESIKSPVFKELQNRVDFINKQNLTIVQLREEFALISETFNSILFNDKSPLKYSVKKFKCTMAFDGRGAIWLQDNKKTANPYFGLAMPGCGELKNSYPGGDKNE